MICLKLFIKNNGKLNNKDNNNMTKENVKTEEKKVNLMQNLKSNAELTKVLSLALKTTTGLETSVLPKISDAIKNVILEYRKMTEKNTKTDESENAVQTKALREHAYSLVDYDRKRDGANSSFETLVGRAIKAGIFSADHPEQMQIDTKTSQIFVMSKIAVPFKTEELKGVKGGVKKIPNTDTNMVPIHTGIIDKVFRGQYHVPTRAKRTPQNDVEKMSFNKIADLFFKDFNKAIDYAMKKDVRYFDMVDDKSHDILSNISALFNSKAYQNFRNFSLDYQVGIDGNLEKIDNKKSA
jgi:hypothetical protein